MRLRLIAPYDARGRHAGHHRAGSCRDHASGPRCSRDDGPVAPSELLLRASVGRRVPARAHCPRVGTSGHAAARPGETRCLLLDEPTSNLDVAHHGARGAPPRFGWRDLAGARGAKNRDAKGGSDNPFSDPIRCRQAGTATTNVRCQIVELTQIQSTIATSSAAVHDPLRRWLAARTIARATIDRTRLRCGSSCGCRTAVLQ